MITLLAESLTTFQVLQLVVPAFMTSTIFLGGLIIYHSRKNRTKIDQLVVDVRQLQTQISPFWSSLQTKVAASLHNPGIEHWELDGLLEKLETDTMTPSEKQELETKLKDLRASAPPDVADKAELLLKVMPMKVKEDAGELPHTDLRSIKEKKTHD